MSVIQCSVIFKENVKKRPDRLKKSRVDWKVRYHHFKHSVWPWEPIRYCLCLIWIHLAVLELPKGLLFFLEFSSETGRFSPVSCLICPQVPTFCSPFSGREITSVAHPDEANKGGLFWIPKNGYGSIFINHNRDLYLYMPTTSFYKSSVFSGFLVPYWLETAAKGLISGCLPPVPALYRRRRWRLQPRSLSGGRWAFHQGFVHWVPFHMSFQRTNDCRRAEIDRIILLRHHRPSEKRWRSRATPTTSAWLWLTLRQVSENRGYGQFGFLLVSPFNWWQFLKPNLTNLWGCCFPLDVGDFPSVGWHWSWFLQAGGCSSVTFSLKLRSTKRSDRFWLSCYCMGHFSTSVWYLRHFSAFSSYLSRKKCVETNGDNGCGTWQQTEVQTQVPSSGNAR